MINTNQWVKDLSYNEMKCFIKWFILNGIKTPDELNKLVYEVEEKKGSGTMKELLSAILSVASERKIQPIPEELQYGIASAMGRLIKSSFEDDIHSRTIDINEFKKQITDLLKPLGVDTKYLFSYVVNIKKEAMDETFNAHSSYWPYPPHKLDALYTLLLKHQFIDPAGQFKAMFLDKNPPLQHRIIWKTNRTDLVYFVYQLYYKTHRESFLDLINRLFIVAKKGGKATSLRDFKKTYYNVKEDFELRELKTNWKTLDDIFSELYLFPSDK